MNFKRFLLSLFLLLGVVGARAQYVFVIGQPANGGEIRVGKSPDLGTYMEGSSLIADAAPGETVYFDFRPYTGWEFSGEITYDENLSSEDVTLREDGIYSFTMPTYEGQLMIMIYVGFQQEQVVATGIDINETNFPDGNFRAWLLSQNYGTDAVITDTEMGSITKIVARACCIENLTGIQFFTELTELDVSNQADVHPEADWNRISAIDLSGNSKLRKLWTDNNQLASVDLTPCPDLRNLEVNNNLLTTLDVSHNSALSLLYCEGNQLSALDLSQNTDLAVVACNGNQLTTLDLSHNPLLEQVYCDNNQLTALNVANHDKLMILNCNDNQLTALDVSGCTELFQLYCYNNRIKGEAMDALVNSLPESYGYMVLVDQDSESEQNELTSDHAAAARAKGWSVEAKNGDDFVQLFVSDEHDYVDLHLTSGTLWATCNVGAIRPQDTGLYFAWGDTVGHDDDTTDGYLFNWENYKWGEVIGEDTYFTKYCSDSSRGTDGFTDNMAVLAPDDDAAYVNWGSGWRTPTYAQLAELRDECTWTEKAYGNVTGYEVTGTNGNSIFLPETGWRLDDMLLDGGAYWSRTTNPKDVGGAYYLGWDSWGWYIFGGRVDGQCVRPVVDSADGAYTVTMPASGIATFSTDRSVNVPEGLTAYTCTTYDSEAATISMSPVGSVIPAETGVLLRGTASESYTLSFADTEVETVSGNVLVAVTVATHVEPTSGELTNFMLSQGTFIRIADSGESSKMPARKAYLQIPSASLPASGRIALRWEDSTTTYLSPLTTHLSPLTPHLSTLSGRRTAKPAKGIFIRGNRKIIMK